MDYAFSEPLTIYRVSCKKIYPTLKINIQHFLSRVFVFPDPILLLCKERWIWPPDPIPGPTPQFVFTGPSPQFVFTGPDPQFVFTGPGPPICIYRS